MGTKKDPGAFDCYEAAEPDEPMFVLLARDKHAPTLVWLWATLRELDGEDQAKIAEARTCCAAMLAWSQGRGRPAVGFGQATLAGVLELIRTTNLAAKDTKNAATDADFIRLLLGETNFGTSEEAA